MKKYLITSQDFYTDNLANFNKILKQQLQIHLPEYALFRDKQTSRYEELAFGFVKICKELGVKSFLHQSAELAFSLKADGVHLTSTQFEDIVDAKKFGLEVIVSTHSHEDVLKAQRLGADTVTYSPIFASPNKGKPKGVEDLKKLLKECSIKVFALGGIVKSEHLQIIEGTGVYGFASIRYFID